MIDGWVPAVIASADTPALDGMLATAAHSLEARVEDTTISGSGQTTFVTGVHRDKHGVDDNNFSSPDLVDHPHAFVRLKEARPQATTASYVTWLPFEAITQGADLQWSHDYADDGDRKAIDALVESLPTTAADWIVLTLSDLDAVGHADGFDASGAPYKAAMEEIDGQIEEVIHALATRESLASEDWLIILGADHAGSGTTHGSNIPEHRETPLIIFGDAASSGTIWPPPDAVDIVATSLHHLGVSPDATWGLDGRVVGLSPSGPPAAALGTNLIFNGNAEHERGQDGFLPDASVPGWDDPDWATTTLYGSTDFPQSEGPGPEDRGANFFCGGATDGATSRSQEIDLSALSDTLATTSLSYSFGAWLGGYADQDDRAEAELSFVDASGEVLGTATLGPVWAADRKDQTGLLQRSASGTVPAGATGATIELRFTRASGHNDGYADSLSLVLQES